MEVRAVLALGARPMTEVHAEEPLVLLLHCLGARLVVSPRVARISVKHAPLRSPLLPLHLMVAQIPPIPYVVLIIAFCMILGRVDELFLFASRSLQIVFISLGVHQCSCRSRLPAPEPPCGVRSGTQLDGSLPLSLPGGLVVVIHLVGGGVDGLLPLDSLPALQSRQRGVHHEVLALGFMPSTPVASSAGRVVVLSTFTAFPI
mmetsp:Transcript_17875/g.29890  ORF Transcript_17875/g.29890 Transcript_17875/m.29890 type:complete len:203 (-) Transcript_17875:167-775(-)